MSGTQAVLEEHLVAGRLDPAEAMIRHLLQQNPLDIDAHIAAARLAGLRGRTDEAITRLEKVLSQKATHPTALAYLAVYWSQKGDGDRALQLSRRAATLGAVVAENDVLLGNSALQRGVLDEAGRFFLRATKKNRKLAAAWLGLGRTYRARGDLADAEDALARAVELSPHLLDAWVVLVGVELDGDADEAAAENLAQALRTHAGNKDLLALKARLEEKRASRTDPIDMAIGQIRESIYANNLDDATRKLYDLIDQAPGDPRLLIIEAELAAVSGQGDIPALINNLTRIVHNRPTAWESRAALGRLLLRNGPLQNLRLALAQCEEAWRSSGEHPRTGLFLFEAYATFGKRAYALALGRRLSGGDGPEARMARQIIKEIDPTSDLTEAAPDPLPFLPLVTTTETADEKK